jgi:replicative DNA helicase
LDVNTSGRIPPQNIEAEQGILGSMLLDSELIPQAAEVLKREDFYREDHSEIYDCILELFEKSQPVDIITVSDQLNMRGTYDRTGGMEYLNSLSNMVPTTANIGYYINQVYGKSILRKLIKTLSEIIDMGYEASEEASVILEKAEKGIFDLIQRKNTRGMIHISEILFEAITRLEKLYNNKGNITGVSTGFADLDMKLAGLQNSDLILIAARPGMGKTSFALNIAQYAALHCEVSVAIFSLEMSKEQLANRLLSSEIMIDSQRLKTGNITEDDWPKIGESLGPLSKAPIYINDTSATTVMEIRAKCRRMKIENRLGLVIIDYIQLMQGNGRSENRQQEISEISRSLKIMAKEIDVPVIAISQLSRAPEQRADHRPMLSDLRESGAIEQDADVVMFLYRDDYYNRDTEKKNIAEVIISKHRNGSTGKIELLWMDEYTKFGSIARGV